MTSFVRQHHAQALVAFAILGTLLFLASLVAAVDSYLLVFHREIHESGPVKFFGGLAPFVAGLILLYAWGPGLFYSARGRDGNIAGISWLCDRSKVLALGRVTGISLFLLGLLLTATALHASTLTRQGGTPAKAYMPTFPSYQIPGRNRATPGGDGAACRTGSERIPRPWKKHTFPTLIRPGP